MNDFCFYIFSLNNHELKDNIWNDIVVWFALTVLLVIEIIYSSEFHDEERFERERRKRGHRNVKKRKPFFERAWYTNLFLIGGEDKIPFKYYIYRYVPLVTYTLAILGSIVNHIFVAHWVVDLYLLNMMLNYCSCGFLILRFIFIKAKNPLALIILFIIAFLVVGAGGIIIHKFV